MENRTCFYVFDMYENLGDFSDFHPIVIRISEVGVGTDFSEFRSSFVIVCFVACQNFWLRSFSCIFTCREILKTCTFSIVCFVACQSYLGDCLPVFAFRHVGQEIMKVGKRPHFLVIRSPCEKKTWKNKWRHAKLYLESKFASEHHVKQWVIGTTCDFCACRTFKVRSNPCFDDVHDYSLAFISWQISVNPPKSVEKICVKSGQNLGKIGPTNFKSSAAKNTWIFRKSVCRYIVFNIANRSAQIFGGFKHSFARFSRRFPRTKICAEICGILEF